MSSRPIDVDLLSYYIYLWETTQQNLSTVSWYVIRVKQTIIYGGGCNGHSSLSLAMHLMSIKVDWNNFIDAMDGIILVMDECPSSNATIPKSFYEAKKVVLRLALPSQKIDYCSNGCMLYYNDTSN